MIGTLLSNRYELIEKIGEGGMAEVYKAKCHKLNRFDAVKILKKEFANDEELVEKFKREATAVANLSDNNIINIFDVGTQDDINFIVMEYVKGKTLKQVIQENVHLSYEKTLDIGIQIAKALDCAHRNNIIHRDVKPQNILVTEEGVVKVSDFGIAKTPTSMTITNTSKVMGSAHYFSPEQAKGGYVDCRTDIYSLGVVLYEMVTGKVPFDAESPVSVALKHIQDPLIPPKQLNNSIPQNLNDLILKAMEKDPVRRYQTVKEMLIDLVHIQKDANYQIITNNVEDDYTKIMDPVNVANGDISEDSDASGKGKKAKMIIIFAVSAVLVILMGALAGWALTKHKPDDSTNLTSDEAKVPSILGKSKDEAEAALSALGLKSTIVERIPSDKDADVVIGVYPKEGTTIKKSQEVRISLSSGKITSTIPNVTEYDLDSAKKTLENYGFQVGSINEEFNDTIPKGAVVRTNPSPDTKAEKNTKVDLWVSKGPDVKYTNIPDLKGKTLAEAEQILKGANLVIGNKNPVDTTDKTLDGKVFNQNKEVGSQAIQGTKVDVSYYQYPKPVVVPEVYGKKVSEVKQALLQSSGKLVIIPGDIDPNATVESISVNNRILKVGETIEGNSTVTINVINGA